MVSRKPLSRLIGFSFGRLRVTEYLGKRKYGKHWWGCLCECGGSTELNTSRITGSSPTLSCGCLRAETCANNRPDPTKHGFTLSQPKLYAIYHGMLYRCYNKKAPRYKYYGGKGIQVCESWKDTPELFFKWALLAKYQEGLSIDRVNPDKGYSPCNCEWGTRSENSRRMNASRRDEGVAPRQAEGLV